MSITNVGKQLGCWGAVCGLILVGVCLSGCHTQSHQQQFAELPPGIAPASSAIPAAASAAAPVAATTASPSTGAAVANVGGPEPEVFRVGDSLTITYSDLPQPTPAFEGKIKEDGTVTLLLNKTFTAAGKTAGELEKEIRAYYVPRYYKYMTVNVKTVESTRWYYVYGEVRQPNRQIYTSRLTVLQAIASSGGFTDFANKKKVKLTRVDGRSQIENCPKAQDNPSLDLEVYPGDKIYVPRRIW
jgi:protein involved in polysaccharide export with SLBB domain